MNEKTKKLLDAFVYRPHSSLLLLGSEHSGVEDCVNFLISELLHGESSNNIIKVYPEDDKSLTIEQVRTFKQSVTTSSRSNDKVARIAFIFGVDTASSDAQNALLKVLEEPVHQTVIVLIGSDRKKILPTITSRCQIVPLLPLSKAQALKIAKEHGIDSALAQKFILLSSGEATLFQQLVTAADASKTDYLTDAKAFLQMTPFDRLQQQKLYDKSATLEKLINELLLLSALGMHNATNAQSVEKWHRIIKELRTLKELLERNVLTKAIFLRLCISL